MSDISETTQSPRKQIKMPPVLLLGGFLMVATAGSTFLTRPDANLPSHNPSPLVSSPDNPADPESAVANPDIEAPAIAEPAATTEPTPPADPEQARLRQLLVGEWQQEYFGKRTLSVGADGTASMTIQPNSVWAIGFGPRIDLTMFWSIKDGFLDYGISGGMPEDKVQLAVKTWGDHWVEKIVQLDEKKLDLLSVDGSTHSIWYRTDGDSSSTSRTVEPQITD